jgi:DNA repair ATPase RecN
MKKLFIRSGVCILLLMGATGMTSSCFGQEQEVEQLALDIQKLTQLKKILQNMIQGVQILTNGYNKVKQVTSGNYSLHEAFLDGLLEVSPSVRKYQRVAGIIRDEGYIIAEYKNAYQRFKNNPVFTLKELDYMGSIYSSLVKQTAQNISELTMVITSGELRMTDDERLSAIDRIYDDTREKLSFFRNFNEKAAQLAAFRENTLENTNTLQKNYGIQ